MAMSVYLIVATVVIFMVGALVALVLAFASGQFSHLDEASRVVLDDDDPMPERTEGGR